MASVVNKVYEYSTVVVADCFALNFVRIQPPRYYGHFFWPPGKNRHTFNCKKTPCEFCHPVTVANVFGPLAKKPSC